MAFMFFTALEARLGSYFPSRKRPAQTDPVGLALSHSNTQDFYPPFTVHAARSLAFASLPIVTETQPITPTEVLPPEIPSQVVVTSSEQTDTPNRTRAPLFRGNMYDRMVQDGTRVWIGGTVSLEALAHGTPRDYTHARRNTPYSLFADGSVEHASSKRKAQSPKLRTPLLGNASKEHPSHTSTYLRSAYQKATSTAQNLFGKLTAALYAFDYARREKPVRTSPLESTRTPLLEETVTYAAPIVPTLPENPAYSNVTNLDAVRQSRERLAKERAERMKLLQKPAYAPQTKPKTDAYRTKAPYNEPFTKPRVSTELFAKKEVHGVNYLFAKNVSYVPKTEPVQEPTAVYAPAALRTRPSMSIQDQIKNRRAGNTYTPRANPSYTDLYSRAA